MDLRIIFHWCNCQTLGGISMFRQVLSMDSFNTLLYRWCLESVHTELCSVILPLVSFTCNGPFDTITSNFFQDAVFLWFGMIQINCCNCCPDANSDTGLQLTIEQGCVMDLQVGVDDCSVVGHPAPVCPAVTALYFVQACNLFQAQNILEALLEIVWQEGIQDGVSAAVGVAKHHHEVKCALHSWSWFDRPGDGGDVKNVEGEPAENEHCHHNGYHTCHFALRALALGGTHAYAWWLHLGEEWAVWKGFGWAIWFYVCVKIKEKNRKTGKWMKTGDNTWLKCKGQNCNRG